MLNENRLVCKVRDYAISTCKVSEIIGFIDGGRS